MCKFHFDRVESCFNKVASSEDEVVSHACEISRDHRSGLLA